MLTMSPTVQRTCIPNKLAFLAGILYYNISRVLFAGAKRVEAPSTVTPPRMSTASRRHSSPTTRGGSLPSSLLLPAWSPKSSRRGQSVKSLGGSSTVWPPVFTRTYAMAKGKLFVRSAFGILRNICAYRLLRSCTLPGLSLVQWYASSCKFCLTQWRARCCYKQHFAASPTYACKVYTTHCKG